jgi:hypothetical protein
VELRRAGDDRAKVIALVKDFKADKYAELQSAQVAVSAPCLSRLTLSSSFDASRYQCSQPVF